MTFDEIINKYKSKNNPTSNKKIQQVLGSIGLYIVVIYLGDGPFSSDIGLVNLHPSRGTHWVVYMKENFFDSYGCAPPQKLSKFIIKQNGHC